MVLVAAMLATAPTMAFAHAHLNSASPGENATVAAPEQVSLGVTQGLEKSFSSIEVRDPSGKRVDNGTVRPETDPARLAIDLPKLAAGIYTVIWHATSVDTHRTEGSFTFTVTP